MSSTSQPSAEPSSAGKQVAENAPRPQLPRTSRRRDKPQVSCNLCRRRKLRCDRQQPCSSCLSRSQICTYADNQAHGGTPPLHKGPPQPASVHDRLVQLERLVISLMPGANPTVQTSNDKPILGQEPSLDSTANLGYSPGDPLTMLDRRSELGSMRVSDSELSYVNGDHWTTILDSIADLKDHFDREEQLRLFGDSPDSYDDGGDGELKISPHGFLLYGCRRQASRAEIMAALPPKDAVDRYVSRYFNRMDIAPMVLHGPTFSREYDAFWMNPNEAPIVWIGLLFSIICLAELSSDVSDLLSSAYHGNSPGEADRQKRHQIELCREMIAQCLFLGEYTKSGPYVLETVIHVVNLEFLIRIDADKDIWFLLAMAVYIAMRMGYHRDPSHFPDISPKQGEIRRRQWATILQGDVLISSQMGMPRMISTWQCDTKEPRNLNDDDLDGLDDAVAEMPPSRPETQLTTSLAVIARRRMVMALGAVEDLTAAVRPSSYAEVMRVDGLLHAALSSVPPPYQSTSASVTDSPQIIITRLFLNHMFYKGQIMLHRKFLCLAPVTQTETGADTISYGYSRKTCLDASLGTLHIQHVLDEETRPGGQLQMVRYRVTSIMNHSFLTATMVLCSFLYRNRLEKQALLQDGEQEKIMAALRRARVIWMRASTHSREAKKAAEAVSLVLARTSPGEDADSWKTKDLVNDVEGAAKPGQSAWPSQPSASSDTTHDGSMGGLYEPEGFNMPNFLGAFMPPVDHFNMTERGSVGLEEWMVMNGPSLGTDWS